MNERIVNKGNALVVGAYKILGFGVLIAILLGLVSYLGLHGFFIVNHSWIAPTIISPTDERILSLSTRIAELAASRERLAAERREMQVRLAEAERQALAGSTFQKRYIAALEGDRTLRSKELTRVQRLRSAHREADDEIERSNKAYAGMSRVRSDEMHTASLLTQEGFLTNNFQIAQIAGANLQIAEKGVGLETQIDLLKREVGSLDTAHWLAVSDGNGEKRPVTLSASVLMLYQQYVNSKLESAKHQDSTEMLATNIAALDQVLANYDTMLASIRNSPYMRALDGNITVAFVPYDNLENALPGTPLYGCSLGLFWCHEVGRIDTTFTGEVTLRHPAEHQMLRGEMVQIRLTDPKWVQREILHARRPPLLF